MTTNIFYGNIEQETINNTFYRKVIFTSQHQQLVVMSIKPNDNVPQEIHPNVDQFVRIEKGHGQLLIGKNRESIYNLSDGFSFIIPAGTWHDIVNSSNNEDLKLYTIYSPPNHPPNTVEVNKPIESESKSNTRKTFNRKYQLY